MCLNGIILLELLDVFEECLIDAPRETQKRLSIVELDLLTGKECNFE